MMRAAVALIALTLASPLAAQGVVNPSVGGGGPAVDQAARDAAAAAQAKADAAATPASVTSAITAATPSDCPAPLPDAMTASAGVQAKCMPKPDAVRATQVYPAVATTLSDGSFSGTWTGGVTLPAAPTRGTATIYGTTVPYHCQLATLSTTGFTGKCWALVSTTLPTVATSLLGLVVSPFTNAAAGLSVNIVARQ